MTVLVLGSFDLLHHGHIAFLNHAAKLGDVVVGLGTDEYQRGYKRQPILTYEERFAALVGMPQVAEVVSRNEVDITPLLDSIKPTYLVVGSDWVGQPFLELSGITVGDLERREIALCFVPRPHDMSTSAILQRVEDSRG